MAKPADFVVDNASGSAVRTDLNNIFDAISINNGFSSGAPTQKYKYMWYADEASSGKMSFYKQNASDKIDFISLSNGNFFGPDGSVSIPSYTFTNSPTTGFYQSTTNQIGVTNNSVNTALFKATGTEIKGKLEVAPASGDAAVDIKTVGNANDTAIHLIADTTYTTGGLLVKRLQTANGKSQLLHRGTGALELIGHDGGTIDFRLGVSASNTLVTRWKFDSAGVFLWAEHVPSLPSGANTSGVIVPKGLASKTGSNASATLSGNLYNFYWNNDSPNKLKCWIDEIDVGQVQGPSSDYRIKRNITTQTESGIDKIKQLRPITYQYADYKVFKADDSIREGFIAHEVQEVIPSGADGVKDGDSIQSLNVDAIVSVLTKALQEAVAKIETLETKVAALEAG